jgi:hypothetical protein
MPKGEFMWMLSIAWVKLIRYLEDCIQLQITGKIKNIS